MRRTFAAVEAALSSINVSTEEPTATMLNHNNNREPLLESLRAIFGGKATRRINECLLSLQLFLTTANIGNTKNVIRVHRDLGPSWQRRITGKACAHEIPFYYGDTLAPRAYDSVAVYTAKDTNSAEGKQFIEKGCRGQASYLFFIFFFAKFVVWKRAGHLIL